MLPTMFSSVGYSDGESYTKVTGMGSGWRHAMMAVFLYAGKTLCEVLTVADAMLLPMAGSRADGSLFRHGSVRPSLQRGGNRTWNRLPRHDCHAARTRSRLTSQHKRRGKCRIGPCLPASGSAWQQDPRWDCLDQRRWPERVDHPDPERRPSQDQEPGTKNPERIYITNMLQNPV